MMSRRPEDFGPTRRRKRETAVSNREKEGADAGDQPDLRPCAAGGRQGQGGSVYHSAGGRGWRAHSADHLQRRHGETGTITVIFQKVGATTMALDQLQEGDCLHDFVGPLGEPTHVEGYGRVAVLGGGLGCASPCRWPRPCTRPAIRWT